MNVISVENASKRFVLSHCRPRNIAEAAKHIVSRTEREEFWALKDVSFDIEQGEAVGIIGHNGAGKSTMLKLLTKIMQPTSGKIRTRGRVSALIEVGAGFHPEMSGRENIYLNGSILGMTKREIDSKFDEIVAFAELEQFIDTPVKRYSSGMYARLGFAVAAHVDPEVLIIDEVLSVGDITFQKKCLTRMGQIANSGSTILYVSHNLNTVKQLCSRALVLDHGQKSFDGDPASAVEYYTGVFLSDGSTFIDYANMPRMDYLPKDKDIEFRSVEILNGNACVFVDTNDVRFKLKWLYQEQVRPVCLRIEIRYSDDTPITSAFLDDVKPKVIDKMAECELSYDIGDLAPGTYKVLLVLYDKPPIGTFCDIDAVWPAFVFTKDCTLDREFNSWNREGWGHTKNFNLSLVN